MRLIGTGLIVLLVACGGGSAPASLTDAERLWCVDHAMNGLNYADGDLVDRAALSLNLVPGARTTEDVRAYWVKIGVGDQSTAMIDWPFRKDPSYVRACQAAYEAAH